MTDDPWKSVKAMGLEAHVGYAHGPRSHWYVALFYADENPNRSSIGTGTGRDVEVALWRALKLAARSISEEDALEERRGR